MQDILGYFVGLFGVLVCFLFAVFWGFFPSLILEPVLLLEKSLDASSDLAVQ